MLPPVEERPYSSLRGRSRLHSAEPTFGELLIDCEEDKAARAVVFGLLTEMERK
jgi:hypothetical protein